MKIVKEKVNLFARNENTRLGYISTFFGKVWACFRVSENFVTVQNCWIELTRRETAWSDRFMIFIELITTENFKRD